MKMVIFVIPAKTGIQTSDVFFWIPACAGMMFSRDSAYGIYETFGSIDSQ